MGAPQSKLRSVGALACSADQAGQAISPWAPPPQIFDVAAPHWSLMAVWQGIAIARLRAPPWLPHINMRGC